jgi:hypothetical protein
MATRRKYSQKQAGIKHGFKSGLEERINRQLESKGIYDSYEKIKIKYTVPARNATYTPDWILPNGVIIESKGLWTVQDRQKHLLVKAQHPELDIRLVFSNPNQKISKVSKTTYANWCDQHGFKWSSKTIPEEWINEPRRS